MNNIPPEVLNKIRENQQNRLTELNLSNYDLDDIPDEVFNFTWLQKLDLSGNKLTKIPQAIANLSSLTTLSLRTNRISNIPAAIANLTKLTKLDLSGNQIKIIPDEIANLINLEKLDISYNQIGVIPKAIAQLPNLKIFRFAKNKIYEPPSEIINQGIRGIREHYNINTGNSTNNNQSQINPDNEAENTNKPSISKKRVKSSWANGLFYLFMFVVVIGLIGYFAGILPPLNLLILVMAGILFVLVIGVLQLLMDGQLSDESFKDIMIKVLEQLPVIGDIIGKILSGNKSNGEE